MIFVQQSFILIKFLKFISAHRHRNQNSSLTMRCRAALLGLVLCLCITWTQIHALAEDTQETRLSNFRSDSPLLGTGFSFADQHRKRLTGILLNSLAKKVQYTSDKLNMLSKLIMDKKEKLFKPKLGFSSNYPPASVPAYAQPHPFPVQPNYGQGFGVSDAGGPGATFDPNYGFESSASITPPHSFVPLAPKHEEPSTIPPPTGPSTEISLAVKDNLLTTSTNTESFVERTSGHSSRPSEDEWVPVPMVLNGGGSSSPARTRRHVSRETLDFSSSADETEEMVLIRKRRETSQIPTKMNAEAQSLQLAFSDLINELEDNINQNQRKYQNDASREREDGFIPIHSDERRADGQPSMEEMKRTVEHLEKARQRFSEIEQHVQERVKSEPSADLKNTLDYFERLLDVEWNRVNAIRKQFYAKVPYKPQGDNRNPVNNIQNDATLPEKLFSSKAKVKVIITSKYTPPKAKDVRHERLE